MLFTCDTEPLDGGDGDGAVKDTRSDFPALADIDLHESAFDLFFGAGNVKHVSADVHAFPNEIVLSEGLAWDAWAGSDIEDVWSGFDVKKFDGSLSHLSLDVLNTGIGLVFGGLVDAVKKFWGKFVLWAVCHFVIPIKWLFTIKVEAISIFYYWPLCFAIY